jgi:cytochrome P450
LGFVVDANDVVGFSADGITAIVSLLFTAACETIEGLIGNAAGPAMASGRRTVPWRCRGVLRFDPPDNRQLQLAMEDLVIAGMDIPAGDAVLPMMGAARRASLGFTDPDRFDSSRPDAGHVSFDLGIYFRFRLGASLARLREPSGARGVGQAALTAPAGAPPSTRCCSPRTRPVALPVVNSTA